MLLILIQLQKYIMKYLKVYFFNDNLEKISGKTQKKNVSTSSIDNYMRLKIDNYVVLVGKIIGKMII